MIARLIAAASLIASTGVATAQEMAGDPAKGERVFRKCQACHAVGVDAKNKVGPILNGIVGREAASVEGFNYSDALKEAAADGLVWNAEEIAALLEQPRSYVKGIRMTFAGLRREEERADVIAYLAGFGPDGEPAEATETDEGEGS